MARTYRAERARRDALARQKGWASFQQRRYVEYTLGLRFMGPRDDRRPTEALQALADACCRGRSHEIAREGSLLCTPCNEAVNPRPPAERTGTYQLRLWRHVSTEIRRDHRGRWVRRSVRRARRTRLANAGAPVAQLEARIQ